LLPTNSRPTLQVHSATQVNRKFNDNPSGILANLPYLPAKNGFGPAHRSAIVEHWQVWLDPLK
jgi:hypothetical protein